MLINVHKPNDNTYLIRPSHPAPMVDHIGKGIYNVSFDPLTGTVTLDKVKTEFKLPAKIRGKSVQVNADIIWATYRRKSTDDCVGAILVGMPGTGKSLTAEIVCNKALVADMPIFMFTDQVPVEVLQMLARITPASVFYFDEFTRLGFIRGEWRSPNARGGVVSGDLLSFFSDSSLKGHIFLLTDNTLESYPPAFVNRPGRFLFRIDYDAMPIDEFKSLMMELAIPFGLHETLISNHIATPYTYDILLRVSEEISRFATVDEQRQLLQIMNIPRKQIGEMVVYYDVDRTGFFLHSSPPPLKAVKVSDKEVILHYQNDAGQSTSTTLHLVDCPKYEVPDLPGIKEILVNWEPGNAPLRINDIVPVVAGRDRNAPRPYSHSQGNHY